MNQERELERHNRLMQQINEANNKEELPNVTPSTLSSFFATNVYFDDRRLKSTEFAHVFQSIIDYGMFACLEVKDIFISILRKNYPEKGEEELFNKYIEIARHPRVNYLVSEIIARHRKIVELEEKKDIEKHQSTMKEIKNAYEIKSLPKVSRASIGKFISDNSKTEYNDKINVGKFKTLVYLLVKGHGITDKEISEELFLICQSENNENANLIHDLLIAQLFGSKKLSYLIEEVRETEKRINWIYKNDHEETMDNIKAARRISQLPPNLSLSTLTGYLSGNSIIYPKADRIPSVACVNMTKLLMNGKRFEDREIIDELARIIMDYYPEKLEESFMLLMDKLSSLPKVYYYAEEVREALKKQKEFITRGGSNVHVYLVPNPKSPMDAGKFYNVYISRAQNLDLQDILPLKLDDIVPPSMDVDSIEWYVQEKHDPTFKLAGGIILNKDEKIGNVLVYQPSDGKIGISPEEHSKYQELEELSKQVKEIIARKKKETSDFAKLQEAFLKSQQATDEELALLEAKIDILTKEAPGRGGRK